MTINERGGALCLSGMTRYADSQGSLPLKRGTLCADAEPDLANYRIGRVFDLLAAYSAP